jgi:hypothetical protein
MFSPFDIGVIFSARRKIFEILNRHKGEEQPRHVQDKYIQGDIL